jgi:hypothetical protein
MAVFTVVAPCRAMMVPWWRRQCRRLKRLQTHTSLHGATTQKTTAIFTVTAVRTSSHKTHTIRRKNIKYWDGPVHPSEFQIRMAVFSNVATYILVVNGRRLSTSLPPPSRWWISRYYKTIRYNIPEDSHLHTLRRENFKSHLQSSFGGKM